MIGTKVIFLYPDEGECPLTLSFECRVPCSLPLSLEDDVEGLPLGDVTRSGRGGGEPGDCCETGKVTVSRGDVGPRIGLLVGTVDTGDCVNGAEDAREDAFPSPVSVCEPLRPKTSSNVVSDALGTDRGWLGVVRVGAAVVVCAGAVERLGEKAWSNENGWDSGTGGRNGRPSTADTGRAEVAVFC